MTSAESTPGDETGIPGEEELTLEELNDLVLAHATERRVVNGVEVDIIYRAPLIRTPATPESIALAERLTPDPAEVARLKAEVEELAASAYKAQQRYLRSLHAEDTDLVTRDE